LIEIATYGQFPGVLHQVAERMRGVRPDDAALSAARAAVRASLAELWSRHTGSSLYLWARAAAEGRTEASVAHEASGAGIARYTLRELQPMLERRFVPANAVLSIAGNLTGLPLRDLVEREFGTIPAGEPIRARTAARLDSARVLLTRAGKPSPAAVVGVIAPALQDSLHPAFFAASLFFGSHATRQWGSPGSAIGSRFRYVLTEDAGLARAYPPISPDDREGETAREAYVMTVQLCALVTPEPGANEAMWRGVDWLLGGPIPPELMRSVRTDRAAPAVLASGQAFRELTGGEAFWSVYRSRFRQAFQAGPQNLLPELVRPERLVQVTFHDAP
jgi:hypothetical protein